MSVNYTTAFPEGDESPISQGGKWSAWPPYGASVGLAIVTNKVRAISGGYGAGLVTSITPGENQQCKFTITTFNPGTTFEHLGPVLKGSTTDQTGYMFSAMKNQGGGQTSKITKIVASSQTVIANESATTWAGGDTMQGTTYGSSPNSVVTLYRNGSSLLTVPDSAITGGYCGFYIQYNTGNVADIEVDDLNCGDCVVPNDVIFLWPSTNASIPSGWPRETNLDAKYPKGTAASTNPGTTGGALTHHHASTAHNHSGAHTHTCAESSGGTGTTARDAGSTRPPVAHTHVVGNTTNPAAAPNLPNDTPDTSDDNNEPPFFTVIFIKSDGTNLGIPASVVGLWNATSAPANWNLCDGASSRPDMRNVFLKGAAAAGDGAGTGGAATHTHASSSVSHTHTANYSHNHPAVTSNATLAGMVGGNISGSAAATATSGHTHSVTIGTQATDAITGNTAGASGSGANEPPYVVQGFIQNNSGGADLPNNIIGLWRGTLATIPIDWFLCDGTNSTPDLRSSYVKGANTLAGVGGTGGSATHGHTAAAHTHPVAAHTHTASGTGDGAGSNESAGGTNCSTTTHTHTYADTGSSSFTSGNGTATISNYTTTEPPFSTVAFIQYHAPLNIQSGALSSTGAGSASIVGASTAAASFSSAGVAAATMVGRSTSAASFSGAGVATASLVGRAIIGKAFTGAGVASVSIVSQTVIGRAFSSDGTATVSLVGSIGSASSEGALSSTGAASATFAGAETAAAALSSAGLATATFGGAQAVPVALTSAAVATVAFIGQTIFQSVTTAQGSAQVVFTGISAPIAAGAMGSDGIATAVFQLGGTFPFALSSAGAASFAGVGEDGAAAPVTEFSEYIVYERRRRA